MSPDRVYVIYDDNTQEILSLHVIFAQAKRAQIKLYKQLPVNRLMDISIHKLSSLIQKINNSKYVDPVG